ncbi:MAG: hypothetical protein ACAI44_21110 [Candidatus Sericytochromatia bacterium]
MKKLLLTILLAALTLPAGAMPKPDDLVGVHMITTASDGIDEVKYFKKWKDIKLSAKTRAALQQKAQSLEKEGYGEKFRIQFLFIASNEVTRVFYLGDSGTVVMMDWPPGQAEGAVCVLSFAANGGYFGTQEKCK